MYVCMYTYIYILQAAKEAAAVKIQSIVRRYSELKKQERTDSALMISRFIRSHVVRIQKQKVCFCMLHTGVFFMLHTFLTQLVRSYMMLSHTYALSHYMFHIY
jgi:hypothetical protein